MFRAIPTLFARYWIAVAVITFASLSLYTSDTTFGQAATPTPDVNTVPPVEEVITPTNTPFPSPTPEDNGGTGGGGGAPRATATRVPGGNDDNSPDSPDDGSPSNTGGNESNSPADAAPAVPSSGPSGTVNAVTLNVRKAPNSGASIVDTLFMGESVEVLGQDSGGGWLYICCGTGAGRPGWISSRFVDLADPTALAAVPVTANTSTPEVAGSPNLTTTNGSTTPLLMEMRPSPAFVWQGQTVELQFVIHNDGDQPLTTVRLRNDLPPALRYVSTSTSAQAQVGTSGAASDGVLFTIEWPEVAAGGQLTATVTVQVVGSVGNGAMIDNLAVVSTAEGAEALAGITFAMPPMRPPRFR